MQMLGNFVWQNETYVFWLCFPSCPKTVPAQLRGLIFIDPTNKFSKKNWNIAHDIMCFIMNVTIA